MSDAWQLAIDSDGVATLCFDCPDEKINKLTSHNMSELQSVIDQVSESSTIKVLLIRSAKPGIFIVGADIAEINHIADEDAALAVVREGQAILQKIEDLSIPTIALIEGICLGGGLELALACDYRLITDHPKVMLGLPEVKLGIIPGFGGTQRLPRLVGLQKGLDLIVSGRSVSGRKAVKLGLADDCVPQEFVSEECQHFIQKVLKKNRQHKPKGMMAWLEKRWVVRQLIARAVKKMVLKKTKGQYPAPLAAIKVLARTYGAWFSSGYDVEAKAFATLAPTQISKNLIGIFYTSEALKKDTGVSSDVSCDPVRSVGVLGAGLMGGGIAWLMSSQDIAVRIKDLKWSFIGHAYQTCYGLYKALCKRRKLKPYEMELKMQKLTGTLDYNGFSNLDLVIEAAPENMEVKKSIFKELESKVGPNTIIASNTSALSITEMGSVLQDPSRFVGMHFFSPVNRMPLVEVIRGEATSDETVARIVQLAKDCKKTAIVVKNCPGFLVNRILLPYVNEAIYLLEEGMSPKEVDRLAVLFGMPMGPLALADEVGLDVGFKVLKVLHEGYGVALPACFETIMEDKSCLGKKTGKGFYVYQDGKSLENKALLSIIQSNGGNPPDRHEAIDRLILIMVNEAAHCLEASVVSSAEFLDMAMVMGVGFPAFRGGLCRYVDQEGVSNIVSRLDKLAKKGASRFDVAPLLRRMAENSQTFY